MKKRRPNHIFTPSSGKTGTTALYTWLLKNELAVNVVDGIKEPYLLLDDKFSYSNLKPNKLPYLDASVGYADDPRKVARFPENSLILFCLRNPLKRLWSNYKMVKIDILKPEGAREYFDSGGSKTMSLKKIELLSSRRDGMKDKRAREVFHINNELIRKQTFIERINYEIAFFLSWHSFPARSLIYTATYNFQMKNLIRYVAPKNIVPLSLSTLHGKALQNFARRYLGASDAVGPIEKIFSHEHIKLEEEEPDFSASEFDILRRCLLFDIEQMRSTISDNKINDSYVCYDELYAQLKP